MIEKDRLKLIKDSLKDYPLFEFVGKGKRGEVYRISENLAVKIDLDDSKSFNSAKNEYDMLKRLEKYGYFPKAIHYNRDLKFLIREYVPGVSIENVSDKNLFIKSLFLARALDLESVNQQELNNPYKHIFFSKSKVMMIDFERARITNNPKNVTQFVQYICNRLSIDPKMLKESLISYKNDNSEPNFQKIIKILKELIQ